MYEHLVITNPKRRSSAVSGRDEWYPFYAGFSGVFARELIGSFVTSGRLTLMDPWNGSGTSTAAAALYGHRALGFDLNPVMAVVAKARLLPRTDLPSVAPLLSDIGKKMPGCRCAAADGDPLLTWFAPDAAASIRAIDTAIHTLLVSAVAVGSTIDSASKMSAIAAFFYVALFRAVQRLLARFKSSNPTWIRRPDCAQWRLMPSAVDIRSSFTSQVSEMSTAIEAEPNEWDLAGADCTIEVASSERLPVPDGNIDVVLSSPPYCTRIDYGVATSPELAVLGLGMAEQLRQLRGVLIGTPTIRGGSYAPDPAWGTTCNAFLERVLRHPSKAAKSYYYKTYVQYFAAISRSISEISRCIKRGGTCIIVAQDSYFKDVRADLATMFGEIAFEWGLVLSRKVDFTMSRTLATINTKSRGYRPISPAVESVLCFTKN
jgi:hypothetical protein